MTVSRHVSSVLTNWIACVSIKKSMFICTHACSICLDPEVTTVTRLELDTGPHGNTSSLLADLTKDST